MTFKKYCDLYLKLNAYLWKPSYINKVEGIIKNRFLYFNDKNIDDIKVSDCKLWYLSINDVSPKTKKDYVSILKNILDIAYYDDLIPRNPALYVKKEKHKTPKIQPFTSDEVKQIIEKSKKYNFNFVYFLAMGFYTGMRTGEILALKKKEVDLKKRLIKIRSTRSRFGESTPKTFSSTRDIPIIDLLYPYINKMYHLHKHEYMLITQYKKPYRDSFVFTQKYWKPILKKLGLKYRRLYTMRHTYATNMLYNNLVTPLQLAQLLGHSSTEMVYSVYVNYLDEKIDDFSRSISVYS